MKMFYSNLFKNYFFLTISLFISEVIFRVVTDLSLVDWSLLRIFVGINIISLLIACLGAFLGRIGGNLLSFLVSLAFSIYAIGQAGFYNYLGQYMSFGTSSQFGAIRDYIKDYIDSFKWQFWLILIPTGFLLLFYIFVDPKIKVMQRNDLIDFSDKFDSEERKKINLKNRKVKDRANFWSGVIASIVLAIAFVGAWYSTLIIPMFQNKLQQISTKSLFENPSQPNIAMGQFGFTGYLFVDAKSLMFPTALEEKTEYDDHYEIVEQKETDWTRHVDSSYWETVIANEKNSNYKKLSNYYISQPIEDKNDYTGLFEGKNLIVIMMESTNNILINEEYYPNLYKLYNEGWAWDNAYSPRNACSTGNNEMSGMVSLFTINNTCTANNYKDNKYPEAIFNLFNEKKLEDGTGYTTSSYHNYTEQYYFRKTIHPNMGSGHYYGVQELGIPYSNLYHEWPSDVALVNKVLEKTENQDHYMVWITSVSAHQPYTQDSTLSKKNMDFFKNTNYNLSLKRYMSKLKEFDLAIGALMEGLEKQGKLEDTVIVLYADHYPYGLNNNTLEKYFDTSLSNFEIDRTPFIIYNSGIKAQKFDEYTSYMNIVPTIANLFNLDFDPRLYAGKDLLSKTYEDRVIFADGSWKDKKAFYSATTGKITYVDNNDTYSIEELQAINKDIKNRISMSNLAIRTNYFNHLYTEINKLKEAEVKVEAEQQNTEEEVQEETTD